MSTDKERMAKAIEESQPQIMQHQLDEALGLFHDINLQVKQMGKGIDAGVHLLTNSEKMYNLRRDLAEYPTAVIVDQQHPPVISLGPSGLGGQYQKEV